MRFGFVGSFGSIAQQVRLAQEVEAHGWDGFFTWDGISVGPMDIWDPWVLLGAVSQVTERIRLGGLIFPLARRRPWKVAREALSVDHLSGGRLVLPVGLGVSDDGGFGRVGGEAATARERAERLDESLEILERAWTGEPFSFHGTHHTVDELVIAPRPVQRPRIPVWPVAALGFARSLGRAARWDGAVLQQARDDGPVSPAQVADAVAWLGGRREELRETEGARLSSSFEVVVHGDLPADEAQAHDHVAALAEAGATWWVESRWDPATTPEALLERVRQGPPVLAG